MGQLIVHEELRIGKCPGEISVPQRRTYPPCITDEKLGHKEVEFLAQAKVLSPPAQATEKCSTEATLGV